MAITEALIGNSSRRWPESFLEVGWAILNSVVRSCPVVLLGNINVLGRWTTTAHGRCQYVFQDTSIEHSVTSCCKMSHCSIRYQVQIALMGVIALVPLWCLLKVSLLSFLSLHYSGLYSLEACIMIWLCGVPFGNHVHHSLLISTWTWHLCQSLFWVTNSSAVFISCVWYLLG